MKRVVITGASGMVATELALLLQKDGGYEISLISTSPDKYRNRFDDPHTKWYSLNGFRKHALESRQRFDVLIHAGFARSSEGEKIADSLQFTQKVAEMAKDIKVGAFVNISSQSVYGKIHAPLWTEDTPPVPDYLYAVGKYASELLGNAILKPTGINYTNIRLSSVCENARFLKIFVSNALENKPINVQGGNQLLSFIDVRDVASALKLVIDKADKFIFQPTYNLSTGNSHTILEMAQMVKTVGETDYDLSPEVTVEPADIRMEVGMDSSRFQSEFSWHPIYDLEDMITALYNYLIKRELGGMSYPLSWIIANCKPNGHETIKTNN